ncbi:hypothetical protein OJ253_1691 [Cryptosporidium canis]|uniref:Hyaluronan/mRNA-binding protein domain-containing protein n=1 Tax=Cryptosporidium canis TaxID=195482 RepID=A0A9D5DKR3_9CRYT|nr:hypothetical protein OJ253_1691 [Cryptosporidium canis]
MRTVYTVNTRNKFAALSLSDDEEDHQVTSKQEAVKAATSAKENPSALIYPKTEVVGASGASVLDTSSKMTRGNRKGNTVHRGGRGGYTSAHGRVFDRRDASGRGHRVSKQTEYAEAKNEGEEVTQEKRYTDSQSQEEVSSGQMDESLAGLEDQSGERAEEAREKEVQMISYEEYMRTMAPRKLDVPRTEVIKGNTTAKDFEKEGLQRYVREDATSVSTTRSSKNKASKSTTRSDKGVFNYFELVEKYSSRNNFNRRGDDRRRNRTQQKPNQTLQVRREAPDVSDTRAFPALGQ